MILFNLFRRNQPTPNDHAQAVLRNLSEIAPAHLHALKTALQEFDRGSMKWGRRKSRSKSTHEAAWNEEHEEARA